MRKTIIFLGILLFANQLSSQVNHHIWDALVSKHVTDKGDVEYKNFTTKDRKALLNYLELMKNNVPNTETEEKERIAFWINVYNAVTVKLILDNYPVESIQDLHPFFKIPGVNTVWHHTYFFEEEERYSLDEIEHSILRKEFDEPRIHFAINCASKSCPPLRNEAYTAEKLEKQLDEQADKFINNSKYNTIAADKADLSKIFSWFKGDFTRFGSLREYINQYSVIELSEDAQIGFVDYDWNLNE